MGGPRLASWWMCGHAGPMPFEPPPDAAYMTSTNRFARYSARFRLRTIHTTATNTTRTPPAKPPLAPDVMSLSPCETAHTHMARYTTMSVRPMANSRPDRLDHIAPAPVLIVLPAYVTPNDPMVHIRHSGRSARPFFAAHVCRYGRIGSGWHERCGSPSIERDPS